MDDLIQPPMDEELPEFGKDRKILVQEDPQISMTSMEDVDMEDAELLSLDRELIHMQPEERKLVSQAVVEDFWQSRDWCDMRS
jgi:hypothetical protein